ncbi:glycoside hydrolase superfamily [Crassisporium funariophilum]|nr:glycoside hydrolase superfamily [Crassisporium funariophilum]
MKFITFVIAALVSQVMGANNFHGIVASNSVGGTSAYTCRTQAQWNTIAANAQSNGFKSIRISGFDCDALHRASRAAAAVGIQVLAGIYIPGTVAASIAQINNEVQVFRSAYAEFGAGRFAGLTIGNEVNDSSGNIMAKVYDVRGYLRSVGVNTPVSTVHTWVRIRDDPALCGADFVGANAHTWFDGGRTSGQAGDFVFKLVVPSLKGKCPGKNVVITETGWPSRGGSNGAAVASVADERNAILNLNCASRDDRSVQVYAFEVDDQVWKHNDVERSFGISKLSLKNDIFTVC